ncbi:MAG TPA: hypothetical protein VJ302_20320 [Blastocatellia bacterium]|nr:hypothetical protein [Blastocatellia bacterium]
MNDLITTLTEIAKHPMKAWGRLGTRHLLLLAAALFSITAYYYLVDFYGADFSVFSYFRVPDLQVGRAFPYLHVGNRRYDFYSGNKSLIYFQIGDYLQKSTGNSSRISIINQGTNGGYANARHVLASQRPSFGIVQGDILKSHDFIREQLNFVTPIYLERMHIIYRKSRLGEFTQMNSGVQDADQEDEPQLNRPRISSNTDRSILRFFSQARIHLGPVGSGTQIIGSYILSDINEQIKGRITEASPSGDIQKVYSSEVDDGMQRLKDGGIDVLFLTTGAPCKSVCELIVDDHRFGLFGIDPTLVTSLNQKYDINLRLTDFQGRYADDVSGDVYREVTTLGTYAYLVTGKNTPSVDILSLLEILDGARPGDGDPALAKRATCQILKAADPAAAPKDLITQALGRDFDFKEYYQKQNHSRFMLVLRSLLVFIVTVSWTFIGAFVSLSWFVSNRQQSSYNAQIAEILEEHLPVTEGPRQVSEDDPYLMSTVDEDHIAIANRIIMGLSKLAELKATISRGSYINDAHATILIERIDQALGELRQNLGIRLNEQIARGDDQITTHKLRMYLMSDWITKLDHAWLNSMLKEQRARHG